MSLLASSGVHATVNASPYRPACRISSPLPSAVLRPPPQGLKAALEAAASIKGLLEMMFEVGTAPVH